MNELRPISTLILSGGRGSRMGGKDKGLIEVDGKPLIALCANAAQEFSAQLIISCNRNTNQYSAYSKYIVSDNDGLFLGPLAGVHSAYDVCSSEWLFTLPCDMPAITSSCFFALEKALLSSQIDAQGTHQYDIAVAHDGKRRQNLVMLIRKRCLPSILDYLASGERRVAGWQNQFRLLEVDCSAMTDTFQNLNTSLDFSRHKKTPPS
ncbi:MAG: molybdenum cofactor guanylyltransferase MobA [Pseudomonadales bacterium]